MPVRMTRPRQSLQQVDGAVERARRAAATSARIAAASVSSTFRASARSAIAARASARRRLHDGVDRHQPAEQRLEQVEPQRVLRVALRARRVVVDLEEHAVDAGGDAGRRERLDVFAPGRR